MKDSLDDRYVRVDDYATRVKGLEFSPQIWGVFAKLAEPRSASEIASAMTLSPDVVQDAIRRLLSGKLIRKEALGWNEFSASSSAAPASAGTGKGVAAAKPTIPATPSPASGKGSATSAAAVSKSAPKNGSVSVPSATVAKPDTSPPVVFLRLASSDALQTKPPIVNLRLSRISASAEKCAPWKLRPILDAIGARAGGGVAGQLMVYKVFLQLPPDVLKAAGLESLNVVDDNFTVTHASLRPALIEAARRHANIDITSLLSA